MALPPPAVEFTVYGVPATKGSKTAFPVRRGGVLTGQVAVREGRSDAFKDWNRRVEEVVQEIAHRPGAPFLEDAIVADIVFYLPKPKSAPKTRPSWPMRKPDLSKLLRAVEDPMNGVLIADDARIVRFVRLEKRYVDPDDPRPRAVVRLWDVESLDGA